MTGIACPQCRATVSSVTDSRHRKLWEIETIQRRRECTCGHRYVTYEITKDTIAAVDKALDDLDKIKRIVRLTMDGEK